MNFNCLAFLEKREALADLGRNPTGHLAGAEGSVHRSWQSPLLPLVFCHRGRAGPRGLDLSPCSALGMFYSSAWWSCL
jgi:hypothetical protein